MIMAPCAIHLFRARVKRCPICAAVREEIIDRGDTRPVQQQKTQAQIEASRRAGRANRPRRAA